MALHPNIYWKKIGTPFTPEPKRRRLGLHEVPEPKRRIIVSKKQLAAKRL